jgi:hypothetical protein
MHEPSLSTVFDYIEPHKRSSPADKRSSPVDKRSSPVDKRSSPADKRSSPVDNLLYFLFEFQPTHACEK